VDVAITSRPLETVGEKSEASVMATGKPPPPSPVNSLKPASWLGEVANAEANEKTPNVVTQVTRTGLAPQPIAKKARRKRAWHNADIARRR
jgi:hypothetical protein